ncbi:uncharacterized protein LOC143287876 [Babylonia areolata]|uniref:uncharacterized protein LOC143287876 n=1 Tax=Babylonia areolata TaxID=304850 RepID=UPI003FCEEB19
MSVISPKKGYGCNPFLYDSITVKETTVAGTQLLLLNISGEEQWRISYRPTAYSRSDQLRDYYRGVFRLVPAYNNDSNKCRVQAGSTHCKLVLAKPLDAEVIFQLTSTTVRNLAEPFSTGETQELTSEVTESSADPSTFENESEVYSEKEYPATSENESEVDYDNEYPATSENESEVAYDNEYDNE